MDIVINNGPKVKKKKTRNKKAKAILEKTIKRCTEFSLRISDAPAPGLKPDIVVVAFVAHMTLEEAQKLEELI